MSDDTIWLVIWAFLVGGIVLPMVLVRVFKLDPKKPSLANQARAVRDRLDAKQKGLKLVRCDCGADTQCPQGRDAKGGGNPYRCQIWKAE